MLSAALVIGALRVKFNKGSLSDSGKNMCTDTGKLLRGLSLHRKSVAR